MYIIYIYTYIHTYTHTHTHIYVYVYVRRPSSSCRQTKCDLNTTVYGDATAYSYARALLLHVCS